MSQPKPTPPTKKVWRISASNPMGEWVEVDIVGKTRKVEPEAPKAPKDLPEVSYGSWVTSSYDLLDGADVVEDEDTVPGDLFDELFPPKPSAAKSPKE